MTKYAFVTQWYPPEPVEIPRNIALSLAGDGHEVQVLTGVPNYPNGQVSEGYTATSVMTETTDGLQVSRTPLYPSHDSSAVKRMLNYASWAVSSAFMGQRTLRRADAVLVYSSPATAALPAMVAKVLWGRPYVLLVQDVWPDSIFASGFLTGPAGRIVRGLVGWFVNRTYAMAAHVAVISPGMADLLVSRGVPPEKVSVVYNWVPEEGAEAAAAGGDDLRRAAGISAEEFVFLYAGNHGHAQALEPLVDAFLGLQDTSARLVLMGDGVTKKSLVERVGSSDRVRFLDPVARDEAAVLIAQSDVSVVSLADEPLFAVTMPSKVQTGLATAKPMLVVARGDAASVVTGSGAGASAVPGDIESIREAVRSLVAEGREGLRAMGARGADLYAKEMASTVGVERLRSLLDNAAAQRRFGRGRGAAATTFEREKQ